VVTTSARSESFAHRPADPPPRPRSKNGKLPPEVDLRRLCDAVARDRRELAPFRRNRLEMVRQYAGAQYGDNAAARRGPGQPARAVRPGHPPGGRERHPAGHALDVRRRPAGHGRRDGAVGQRRAGADAGGGDVPRVVYDALFWVGIGKVALATPADAAAEAWDVEAGQPFLEATWTPTTSPVTPPPGRSPGARTTAAATACRWTLANELYAKGRAEQFEAVRPGGRGRRRGRPDLHRQRPGRAAGPAGGRMHLHGSLPRAAQNGRHPAGLGRGAGPGPRAGPGAAVGGAE
jgi:hypothetical protein